MKIANLLYVLLLLFMASGLQAQEMKENRNEIAEISEAVKLDDTQVLKLNEIYQKRAEDLKLIEELRNKDEQSFYRKRLAIYKGSQASVDLLINPEQREQYNSYKKYLRNKRAVKVQELKKNNAPLQDIIDAQFGVQTIN